VIKIYTFYSSRWKLHCHHCKWLIDIWSVRRDALTNGNAFLNTAVTALSVTI